MILTAVFFVLWFFCTVMYSDYDFEALGVCRYVFGYLFLLSLVSGIIISCIGYGKYKAIYSEQTLVAIRDKSGVSGSFFLGSGTIDEQQYYFYYAKLPNGGFIADKILSNGVTIYEEKRKDAVLRKYECVFRNKWMRLIAIDSGAYEVEFHVPIGTIRRGFSI
jgi:hypothetical protein